MRKPQKNVALLCRFLLSYHLLKTTGTVTDVIFFTVSTTVNSQSLSQSCQ